MMYLIRPQLWITLLVLLAIISIVVGCTPTKPLAGTSEIEPQDTDSIQPTPTIEPSPTPEIEPSATEIPTTEVPTSTPEPVLLLNPGFEDQETSRIPTGWNHIGAAEAITVEDRGHSGDFRLTHRSSETYQIETWQTVSGLENGWYTLRVWARSTGDQNAVYIALRCGGDERRVNVPSTMPGYRWIQLVVSNQVNDGECTISLYSDGNPDTWASFDDVELVPGRAALSILGADISSLMKSEDM
ncbi:MAG: hypothetical protein JSV37_02130, partial [Anaerolineaceae bacterium]